MLQFSEFSLPFAPRYGRASIPVWVSDPPENQRFEVNYYRLKAVVIYFECPSVSRNQPLFSGHFLGKEPAVDGVGCRVFGGLNSSFLQLFFDDVFGARDRPFDLDCLVSFV